jgi:hypothetical protein
MPHTIITYLFNISSIFVKMAKNPSTVRRFKIEGTIDAEEIRLANIMTSTLVNNLQVCTATSSLQVLFAHPPSSFELFCPHLINKDQDKNNLTGKRPLPNDNKDNDGKKNQKTGAGAIINTTGSRLIFPKGLSNKYCADFLDVNATCRHGEKCNFVHAVFPSGFTAEDVKIMEEHVQKTNGLRFKHYNNKVS